MINFPDTPRPPTVAHKGLRQRYRLGHLVAKMTVEVINLDRIRPQPRHHARARRIAKRQLIIRPIKPHATRREPVNVRRLRNQIPITPQRRRKIVDGNEEDVWFGSAPANADKTQAEDDDKKSHGNAASSRHRNAAARKSGSS